MSADPLTSQQWKALYIYITIKVCTTNWALLRAYRSGLEIHYDLGAKEVGLNVFQNQNLSERRTYTVAMKKKKVGVSPQE